MAATAPVSMYRDMSRAWECSCQPIPAPFLVPVGVYPYKAASPTLRILDAQPGRLPLYASILLCPTLRRPLSPTPRVSVAPAIVCPELLASYHDLWAAHRRRKSSRDLGGAPTDISQPGSVRAAHDPIRYERWDRHSARNGFAGQSHRFT